MKFFLLSVSIFCSFFSFSQTIKFNIDGHTFHQTGKARLLLQSSNAYFPFDSATITNGIFSFTDSMDEPKLFQLQIEDEKRDLFIGNETITVNQKDSATKEIVVTGSSLTNDYDRYKTKYINSKSSSDSAAAFIRKYPSSFVSVYLLNQYSDAYNVIQLNGLYRLLGNGLKQYPSAKNINQKIDFALHQSAKCPPFFIKDKDGKPIDLTFFKNGYVLLNFWASWCVPCVRSIPALQKAAEQFKGKSFQILMVSLDTDTAAWKLAVNKYHLPAVGINAVLQNGFRNEMARQFNVSFIPANVLVDPSGNIIGRNIEGEELLQKLETLFSQQTRNSKAQNTFVKTITLSQ